MANCGITEADVEAYQRDGAVCLRGVFADWVETLIRGLDANLEAPGPYICESTEEGEPGRFFDDYCNWQRIPEYRDYVLNSPAAEIAARVMRSERAQFFHEHVFLKETDTQHATPWHHDLPYYCVDGRQTVSIWVPLDPVSRDIAVLFVAGSHRWERLFYPRNFIDGSHFDHDDPRLEPVPDIDANEGDYRILSWETRPGDALLFDFRTLHGTSAGLISGRRRAFATRWLGDDVRYCQRSGETSPPYPGIGLKSGDPMREDWFPVLWPR